ncbi:MAG: hypothetical protein RJB34_1624 [Pseudomonadota bacterium]
MLAIALLLITLPLQLPAYAMLLFTLAAGRARAPRATTSAQAPRPSVAVLVPAHNESAHVLPTLACLLPQLQPGDTLLVIADNCNDDTAEVARQAGATVVERHHPEQRGKGYALDHGVQHLRAHPPAVVMVIDADCTVSPNTLDVMAWAAHNAQLPVQMLNLMQASPGAGLRHRMLEFAMIVKNKVRPLGAQRLGGACHLMGTGMAIPWALISTWPLATGHIAEDMQMGIETARRGQPATFNTEVQILSAFPEHEQDAQAQKSRWEHGHLATMTQSLPALVGAAIRQRRWALWVLALDLLIPPLTLYTTALVGVSVLLLAASAGWPTLFAWPTLGALAACVALGASIVLAWWQHARHLIGLRELCLTPLYVLWKMPIYIAYWAGKQAAWVRARRTTDTKPR